MCVFSRVWASSTTREWTPEFNLKVKVEFISKISINFWNAALHKVRLPSHVCAQHRVALALDMVFGSTLGPCADLYLLCCVLPNAVTRVSDGESVALGWVLPSRQWQKQIKHSCSRKNWQSEGLRPFAPDHNWPRTSEQKSQAPSGQVLRWVLLQRALRHRAGACNWEIIHSQRHDQKWRRHFRIYCERIANKRTAHCLAV